MLSPGSKESRKNRDSFPPPLRWKKLNVGIIRKACFLYYLKWNKKMIKVYIVILTIFISTLILFCSSHKVKTANTESIKHVKIPKDTIENKKVWGIGYGGNYGNDSANVDSLIESLIDTTKTGIRQVGEIMKTIMMNLASFRNAYNKRLREKPGLKGRVTYKIIILETGSVHKCSIVSTTINDRKFERILLNKIKKWDFGKIDKSRDTTVLVYPFMFSQ